MLTQDELLIKELLFKFTQGRVNYSDEVIKAETKSCLELRKSINTIIVPGRRKKTYKDSRKELK